MENTLMSTVTYWNILLIHRIPRKTINIWPHEKGIGRVFLVDSHLFHEAYMREASFCLLDAVSRSGFTELTLFALSLQLHSMMEVLVPLCHCQLSQFPHSWRLNLQEIRVLFKYFCAYLVYFSILNRQHADWYNAFKQEIFTFVQTQICKLF